MERAESRSRARLMTPRCWRLPLFWSGLVLLSQTYPLPSSVRDAASLSWQPEFHLSFPMWHLVFTPFCSGADCLTVLGAHQAAVLMIWILVLFVLLVGVRRSLALMTLLLLFLAWGALVPRPMGKLKAQDPDVLLIDFHSHTQYSHDGRPSFTPEANRRWHREQGYDAGFITDHNRTEAAQKAKELSRRDWTETGYRSLEGEEISLKKTHLVILGNHDKVDNRPFDSDPGKIPLFLADMHRKGYPVIASLPEYWFYHWGEGVNDFVKWGMNGFELINSAPKALDFPLQKRLEIVDLCRRQNLFMTGISDNHGYGYATACWNAMRIPGWRTMDPDMLEDAILENLRTNRFDAVQVLERVRFIPESALTLVLSPIGSVWLYWRSLQPLQALSWAVWIFLVGILYPRRTSGTQRSGPKL